MTVPRNELKLMAMETHLTPEEDEQQFLLAIREGISQADRGEFIEEEEMDARVRRMFQP